MSAPPAAPRVAIIGLGLIGGSLARDLAALGWRVLAYDRDPASLQSARNEGVVHETLDPAAPAEVDVAAIAVPVSAFAGAVDEWLPWLSRARLVMDAGSTKRSAIRAAEAAGIGGHFVGGHPMAGDHRSGWSASRNGLFAGAMVYLCRTRTTTDDALRTADDFWQCVGATAREIEAGAHDHRLAYASHLPQMASKALALTLASAGIRPDDLGPGGRDATRLARSNAGMWTAIALDNADELLPALTDYAGRVSAMRDAVERRDGDALRALFTAARRWSS